MYENDPAIDPRSIVPPSTELEPAPAIGGEVAAPPEWHPHLSLPPRDLVQKPRWPHPNLGWSFLWCVLFWFVTQLPGSILAVVVAVGLMLLQPEQYPLSILSNQKALLQSEPMQIGLAVGVFVIELSVVGFSLLVIRLVVGRDWMRQLALRRPSLEHTLLTLASFPVLVLMGNVVYNLLRSVLHVPSLSDYGVGGMEEMVQVASKWPAALAVLLIGLGPGIGEELWCRGFLGRGLVGNYGAVFGVLATSFLFGLLHVDPCQGAMAMVMGLWLHFVYLSTRSLLLPMLLHFLNNSFGVLATRFESLQMLDAKPQDIPVSIYVTSLLLLLAVGYALYQSRARLAAKVPDLPLVWRPAYAGVEYPPPGSGTEVVHPSPSAAAAGLVAVCFLLFVLACAAWVRQG